MQDKWATNLQAIEQLKLPNKTADITLLYVTCTLFLYSFLMQSLGILQNAIRYYGN